MHSRVRVSLNEQALPASTQCPSPNPPGARKKPHTADSVTELLALLDCQMDCPSFGSSERPDTVIRGWVDESWRPEENVGHGWRRELRVGHRGHHQ